MQPALDQYIAGVNEDHLYPTSKRPDAVCRRLQAALAFSGFHVDCARAWLEQMTSTPDAAVFFADHLGRYTLQIFCWPPGFSNPPHHHDTWTVAGVLTGSLLVYRSHSSEAACLASEPIVATAGQAGMLIPPQFHCMRNPRRETAITFHVFSLNNAATSQDLDQRASSVASFDDDDVVAIAKMAVDRGGCDALDCVRLAFFLVGPAAQLDLIKLTMTYDRREGVRMGRTLCRLVGGVDGHRLSSVLDELEAEEHRRVGAL
jgi:predicted metal-dependent enzyme (double-stranded beta helix superfamily)